MKKITARLTVMLLVMLMALTMVVPAAFAKGAEGKNFKGNLQGKAQWKMGFSDVDETLDWARMAIDKMYAKGIFKGYPGDVFKPRNNISNLEAIVIALRIMGWEEEVDGVKVLPNSVKNLQVPWLKGYYYIALAVQKGLVKPDELKGFNPNAPAKRYEVARYVVRALGKEAEAREHMKDKLSFKDAKAIPKDAVGYVYVITDLGLMKGDDKGLFKPQNPITRAEMAVLVNRLDGTLEPEDKNELVGTVEDVNIEELTITIKNSFGEKTYDVLKNTPVYIDGKYRDMEDLNEGDRVELVLNDDGDVVFIQVLEKNEEPITVSARGLVTDVDEDDKTVSLFTYVKDNDKGFVGILEKNNVEGWHYELSTEAGTFALIGDTDGLEDYVGKRIVVVGTLKAQASIYMRGDLIEVEDFYPVKTSNVVTFRVNEDTEITVDGKTAELSDIEPGDMAEVKAQDGTALEIKVYSFRDRIQDRERERKEIKDGKLKGEVVSLTLRTQWEITVENEDGIYTFVLDSDVDLDNIDKISDIKAGMEIELRIKNGKVTEIKAEE
ncbi:S-layer homology domain-containing protein [Biomaibacter acetigenes]|uniref:S-layer homology domain-containing protein n=1 Tax=Biomaibacter acetigenes TaxID=2316383 RepID=A0A3G2R2C5_9FIRM|nr:S-layer homology domain-containing protein [Biomaibacter acetigenes]AYO29522.1 S-layer homology domain-containing protein [Biomaibacter acetigenes]